MKNFQSNGTYNFDQLKKIAGIVLLAGLAVIMAMVIVKMGEKMGTLIIVGLLGIGLIAYSFLNTAFGFYASIVSGYSIFILARKFGMEIPWATIVEVQIMTTFAGMIFGKMVRKDPVFEGAKHPITYGYLVYTLFLLIQLFNPSMESVEGWAFVFRRFLQFLMIYLIALEVFKDIRQIRYYFSFWVIFACIAGAYGCYQEWFGMFEFEINWIWAVPGRSGLYSLDNGNFRKFSLFSDPAAYGICMAVSGLFTMILAIGTSHKKTKFILLAASVFMFIGMAFSGTRTAFSIVPAGLILYILMTITRRTTLLFACICLASFVVIIWGPIYGNPTVNRIRSTFEFSEDASMQVRDMNRKAIQPYIYKHPIGGGLATTGMMGLEYNPNHILSGFPPDSGFLRTAVETGWVGLALQCMLYFIILYAGVRGYYNSQNKLIRLYFLAAVVAIFSNIMAQYAQVSIGQIPGCFLFYPFLAILARLNQYTSSQAKLK